jgi:hypothetical protein
MTAARVPARRAAASAVIAAAVIAGWPAAAQAAPAAPTAPARPAAPAAAAGCSWLSITCHVTQAVSNWFAGLVTSAINPLFGLLGRFLLSTPQPAGIPAVRGLWTGSLAIADAAYVLAILAGAVIVMSHQTLQTRYAVKEIAPRLVTGFVAANLSLWAAGQMISLADSLSAALAGQGLDPAQAGSMIRSLIEQTIGTSGLFFILLAVLAVVLVLVLVIIYVARIMLMVILLAVAPLALACHALPQTEQLARWWWRAFTGVLLIQSAQAIVLVATARLFFTQQWIVTILGVTAGPQAAAGLDAIELLCVLYILIRIPFWIGRRAWSGHGSGSPLRTAARFVIGAAVLRRISPALSGATAARSAAVARGSGAGRSRARPAGAATRPAPGRRPPQPGRPGGGTGSANPPPRPRPGTP